MVTAPNPLHYAVVVGISTYPGGYRHLSGPVNDAGAFANWLKQKRGGGLPRENVCLIVSPPGARMSLAEAKPLKYEIDRALWNTRKALLKAVADLPEEDRAGAHRRARLYLMVAGHGIMPAAGKAALLDAEAEPARQTNLELSLYGDWFFRDGTFGEVCVFADCCRSFELLAVGRGPDFDSPGQLGQPVSVLVGYATSAGELSFEDIGETIPPDERRGYFSRALVDGLEGNAAEPSSGFVTAESLRDHVRGVVEASAADRHRRQEVFMPVDGNRAMTFGPRRRVRAAKGGPVGPRGRERRQVRISFPAGFAGAVELLGPDRSTLYWKASAGPWTVWLFDASWVVQHAGRMLDTSGFADAGAFTVSGGDLDVQL